MIVNNSKYTQIFDIVIGLLLIGLLVRMYLPNAPFSFFSEPALHPQSNGISIEDIVRELHAHADKLEPDDRKELRIKLEEATKERDQLLLLMTEVQAMDTELNQAAIQVWDELSPENRNFIRQQRNTISVQELEAEYWVQTKEELGVE
jgi:hypothetical protein